MAGWFVRPSLWIEALLAAFVAFLVTADIGPIAPGLQASWAGRLPGGEASELPRTGHSACTLRRHRSTMRLLRASLLVEFAWLFSCIAGLSWNRPYVFGLVAWAFLLTRGWRQVGRVPSWQVSTWSFGLAVLFVGFWPGFTILSRSCVTPLMNALTLTFPLLVLSTGRFAIVLLVWLIRGRARGRPSRLPWTSNSIPTRDDSDIARRDE